MICFMSNLCAGHATLLVYIYSDNYCLCACVHACKILMMMIMIHLCVWVHNGGVCGGGVCEGVCIMVRV